MSAATALENVDRTLDAVAIEEKIFELAQRKAKVYADSSLVPEAYRGKIGNVLIADNMARRMGADLLMVMQNLYLVHGKPGWSATFLIASFNSNGKFSAIKYRFKGDEHTPEWGCQAYCTEIATGEEISGAWVTWAMANAEGWVNRAGSKWKTMPEQMFRYRSATFMIRATAPEIGMGLLTKEELEDMPTQNGNGAADTEPRHGVTGLKDRLKLVQGEDEPEAPASDVPAIEAEPVLDDPQPDYVEPGIHEPPADEQADEEAGTISPESQLENLVTFAKDKLREITKGNARKTTEILNGRRIDSFDLKQANAFIAELEKLEA